MKKNKKEKQSVINIAKDNVKLIVIIMVIVITLSVTTAYGATILFSSEEVSYDNTTSGLDAGNVQSALDELYVESTSYQLFEQRVSAIENKLYPVGSIYLSLTDDTVSKVQNKLGGTWEKIGQGRTLIGEGTNGTYTFEAGSTGGETVAGNSSSASQTIINPLGEYTHKLNVDEMPSHSHDMYYVTSTNVADHFGGSTANYGLYTSPGGAQQPTGSIGGTIANTGSSYYHNNIQPYLVVYMYKRTA